ncbi:MAG: LCP family protein [Nitriliruptoraceae bacterium]|nr:LCP family protein [Nitriliruptoraceae bacterium]
MPARELSFSSTRVPPGRKALRIAGVAAAVVATFLGIWLAVVAVLWGYTFLRLGPEEVPALSEEVTALGPSDTRAPQDATTVLVTMTGPVDPTVPRESPLEGPVALVQVGGPREEPAVLLLPAELPVTIEGLGELTLAEVQLEGGLDLVTRAVAEYSAVRIDHVASLSVDALPELADVLAPLEVCGSTGCRQVDGADVRAQLDAAEDPDLVRITAEVLQAVARRVDGRFAATSPLQARRVVDVIGAEIATDVSLRGTSLLAMADVFAPPVRIDRDTLPLIVNPESGAILPLEEPAMVRFQALQDGTPLLGPGGITVEDVEQGFKDEVRLAVLNGAGIDGLAGEVEVRLQAEGFQVLGTGNAPSFDRERTVVNYVAGEDDAVDYVAALVAEALDGAALEPLDTALEFEGEPVDLLITIGTDQDRSG